MSGCIDENLNEIKHKKRDKKVVVSEKEFDLSIDLSARSKVLIMGGGCYGSLFSSRIARAREKGFIDYSNQLVVDINPECELKLKEQRDAIIFTNSDWIDFLLIYFKYLINDNDYIVLPCNTPHFIYQFYMRQLQGEGTVTIESVPFNEKTGFPFEKNAEDTSYISFADWQCMHLCREPEVCPATRIPRSWDIKKELMTFMMKHEIFSSLKPFIFECERYVNGVAVIKAKKIIDDYHVLLNSIEKSSQLYMVATLSHCHGAFSMFSAKRS